MSQEEDLPRSPDEYEQALVELVRFDYDATLRVLGGFVSTGNQIRAIGIAAWGVVLGLAVRDESTVLALLATGLLVVFALTDAYHAALYRRALGRAVEIEGVLDGWIDRLGIDADDSDAVDGQRARLETHRFGIHRSLRRPDWRDMLKAGPSWVFRIVYPVLLMTSIVSAFVYACD
jgi:hypothetical protein